MDERLAVVLRAASMQAGLAQPCSELPVQCSLSHRPARVGKSSVTRLDPDSQTIALCSRSDLLTGFSFGPLARSLAGHRRLAGRST